MKKLISVILIMAIVSLSTLFTVTAGAVGETTGEVNVIFLVDASRSMKKSDPDSLRLEAIKLFADLCTLEKTKIGFVLFGSEVNYEQTPMAINTEADRTAVKKKADELTDLKGSTDIGMALLHTVETFASEGAGQEGRFIVFLSDGKTVITGGDGTRTLEDSEADLESGILKAKEAGIPIYTIGLNAGGEVDEKQLRHISAETYADDTYMTNSAGDLSEILSDIYVRHTGAENRRIASFTSMGGEHDTAFDIADGSVIEANLVVMHSAKPQDIKITDPDGTEIAFDGKQADISHSEGHTLIKLYCPKPGTWHLFVTSAEDTKIDIRYILTRDFRLTMEISSDKAIGKDAKVKFNAVLTDPNGVQITDESILGMLLGKLTVKNETSSETSEIVLVYEEGIFKAEYDVKTDDNYTVQASLYNNNIDIRSEMILLENGSETYKVPEGPLKLILICVGSGIAFIALVIFAIKQITKNIRMYSGKLVITANVGGVPSMPLSYDFAKRCPGRRKIMLSKVLKDLEEPTLSEAVPKAVTSAIAITMNSTGEVRVSGVKGVEHSGGVTIGKNIILSNANRLTLRYADKNTGSNNMLIIQYLRT